MKYIVFLLVPFMLFAQEADEGFLGGSKKFQAYKVNYLLPVSYADESYQSGLIDTEYKPLELEIQVSFKYNFAKNLFGYGGKYYGAYSQHAFWQIYAYSKPFRENIYNPEIFARYDIDGFEDIAFKSLQVGYEHQSNGQPNTENTTVDGVAIGNTSRSLDTVYSILSFRTPNLHTDLKFWFPVASLSDNPDLMDYIGYTGINMKYFYNDNTVGLSARGNLATKKGSLELSYAYPIGGSVNLYMKFFTGYGESMIAYEDYVNKFSIGFSFSR